MILKDMARTGAGLKITAVVFLILISCISKSFAEIRPLTGVERVEMCLENGYGCLQEDLESFIDVLKVKDLKSLYCTMLSPFQQTEKNRLVFVK